MSMLSSSLASVLATLLFATPPEAAPEGLEPPTLLNEATLVYPAELASQDEPPAGTVVVKYVVCVDGKTKEAEVVEPVHPDIDAAALEAVAKLEYEPARFEGEPVELVLSIELQVEPPAKPEPVATQPESEPEPEPEPEPAPPAPVRVKGKILEAGQRAPIKGAIVSAIPAGDMKPGRVPYRKRKPPASAPAWTVQDTTDSEGNFALRGVPDGRVRIIVITQGFERYEYVAELRGGEQLTVKYYQVRMNTNPYRTEVSIEPDAMEEVASRVVTTEEIQKIPGTNGDALRSIQNFPGVARPPFASGQLVIRGAAPGDSAVFLGHHEIPALFHFGGLTSVFNADLIKSIDYVPGNFDSRYGDAIGGIVDVEPRKGRRDGFHGYVDVDVFDASAVMEGPVGKGSIAVGARRSYIDAILPAVIPDDSGLNFTVAPRYWDYQMLFDYPLAGGEFSARVFGSDDSTRLVFGDPNDDEPDARGGFSTDLWFHRADLVYKKKHGPWTFLITPSYRRDFTSITGLDIFRFNFVTDRLSARAEVTRRLGKRSQFRLGTEVVSDWTKADVKAPPVQGFAISSRGGEGPSGGGQNQELVRQGRAVSARPAIYTTFKVGLHDRFSLYPGMRLTYYNEPRAGVAFDPRLRFVIDATDTTRISGGVGVHSQGATVPESDEVFGNPNLRPEQSLHSSLGVEQRFLDDWVVGVTGFHKHLWSLIVSSPEITQQDDGTLVPELFANTGRGRVYGAEFLVRKDLTRKLYGWISYTVSRSEVQFDRGQPYNLFSFDQTHLLTAIVSYKLPRNWQVGARFRVASGNPYTPTNGGVTQLYDGFETELNGDFNSARLRTFHQLDFRVDKTWSFRLVKLGAYLDVQNLYNAKNPEFINYSWDFQNSATVNSLPIIPSLGVKLEW